jgi:ABC-type nitrate/sulfonate/bicarbonate transport system substrate-binding protein
VVEDELKLCGEVDLEFVSIDNLDQAKRALDRGEIDVAMWLIDTHAEARSRGISTKVVLKLDVSLAADAILARPGINTFADLKGKKVAYQKDEASHFLLMALCKKEQISLDDLDLVQTNSVKEATDRFLAESDIAAVGTYNPYLLKAQEKMQGARVIASGADAPDAIVDILTVEEKYLRDHPDKVEKLLQGWFKAVDILNRRTDPRHQEAVAVACLFNGDPGPGKKWSATEWKQNKPCEPAKYYAMTSVNEMRYCDEAENTRFFFPRESGANLFQELFRKAQDNRRRELTITPPEEGDGSANFLDVFNPAK